MVRTSANFDLIFFHIALIYFS